MDKENVNKDFENHYSRQIGTFGMETMGKLIKMRVFIQGLRGTGIETAKNLILAGPKQVVLRDNELTRIEDLGTNFYLKENDVNKNTRAEGSLNELKNLNQYVDVSINKDKEITKEFLKNFDVVVFTDYYDIKEMVLINEFCRNQEKAIGFIMSGILGLFGYTFVDFGPKHILFDKDGENCITNLITHISNEEEGIVTCQPEKRHNLKDGDHVVFREVKGMDEVNEKEYKIKVVNPYSFKIGNTSNFKKYQGEGICEQVKEKCEIKFKSLNESLNDPLGIDVNELINPELDFERLNKPFDLHIHLKKLLEFYSENKRLPNLNDQEILKKNINDEIKNKMILENENKNYNAMLDEKLVNKLCRFSECQITASSSFWGGIIAQEIVKFTGKYMPIRQWMLYENYCTIFNEELEKKETTIVENRYKHQIMLFGEEFHNKLINQNVLMVGAGALGCEYLKIFSLMGMCSKNKFSVTDDDSIEISNLNRQFLFRKEHVGQSKSQTASNVVNIINHEFNSNVYKTRVSPDNENIFTDQFFDNLDFVVNAVDNVKAREYIDQKCVMHKKQLFESGTLGTKCNSQLIIPFKTESYSDSQDPPETGIPLCTLRNYPYLIDHTIEWARDYFQKFFVDGSCDLQSYLQDPNKFVNDCNKEIVSLSNSNIKEKLESILFFVKIILEKTLKSYIVLARQLFQTIFHDQIALLLYSLPLDHTDDDGNLFWRSPKRPPQILEFSSKDPTHFMFIKSIIIILKNIFNDNNNYSDSEIINLLDVCKPKELVLKKIKVQKTDDEPEETNNMDDSEISKNLLNELSQYNNNKFEKINAVDFEKDDDSNGHIDFISAIANLRARNYKIQEIERHKIKMIAGKIIPAIATTTAMVCGAVTFEIIKKLLDIKFDNMRNFFSNLAIPIFLFSEPMPFVVQKDKDYDPILLGPVKTFPKNWNTWDRLEINGSLTLNQFMAEAKNKYGINIDLITYESAQIWMDYTPNFKDRENMLMEDILIKIKGNEFFYPNKKYVKFHIGCNTDDGDDLFVPYIIYNLK